MIWSFDRENSPLSTCTRPRRAGLFCSGAICIFQSPGIGRVVMFIFNFIEIEVTKPRLWKFPHSGGMLEYWFSGLNRFKTKNKHHHSTQRGRLSYHDPIFRMIGGHLTDFRALGKILTAPERNKPVSSALHRSKEDNFIYRMVIWKLKIECKMFSEFCPQTTVKYRRECVKFVHFSTSSNSRTDIIFIHLF